ncbi:hypothetical protein N7516_004757 [Penicillium verrucosum]|uniref:Uncharacterized protein n=1 Tax=Penicillium cf. viridicatum TaxID=2972119 RepID=A0A9W9T4N8_9EURO|nr:uncharacterized protein N7516_004757 [Penicillium verrucosum]KAJ5208460.1 hypothetical protein N7449_002839 [Penicillium cf. viridicatum]KAJ5406641.1 hypothetical protein N7465_007925 [Penicillium sp. CMV-2018d]KAJ5534633.1 hypothetical protein N7527_000887 [Penicillium freii]KAJ5954631.1 hypothetical protein N7501_008910 [Penicillium viridicatum]KAJ5944589.1 hypothetical protein N7516_004757 [Penicillium verrucosum]
MDKIKTPKEEPQEKTESQPMTVEDYQKKWDQMLQDTAKQIDKIRENELARRSNNNQTEQR